MSHTKLKSLHLVTSSFYNLVSVVLGLLEQQPSFTLQIKDQSPWKCNTGESHQQYLMIWRLISLVMIFMEKPYAWKAAFMQKPCFHNLLFLFPVYLVHALYIYNTHLKPCCLMAHLLSPCRWKPGVWARHHFQE